MTGHLLDKFVSWPFSFYLSGTAQQKTRGRRVWCGYWRLWWGWRWQTQDSCSCKKYRFTDTEHIHTDVNCLRSYLPHVFVTCVWRQRMQKEIRSTRTMTRSCCYHLAGGCMTRMTRRKRRRKRRATEDLIAQLKLACSIRICSCRT